VPLTPRIRSLVASTKHRMAQVLAGLTKTTLDMIPAYAKQTAQRLQNSLFRRDQDEYER
jgi:hypothetical protein